MKIVIQSSALGDLADGFDFYERIEPGLGGYFLNSSYSDIDSLQLYAGIHIIHFGKYHRLLSKRFPYGIYYRVEENTVLVRAVLDLRRDPKWIRRRLE
ncbi:MAG: type II toxin-antitoxin system RelE/ParE family toxin [Verrucomicrobiota bacterium]|nr:type II toxin-antitoxin system RelE/ParE family toxin [Verrucomicrobiota bacterium]